MAAIRASYSDVCVEIQSLISLRVSYVAGAPSIRSSIAALIRPSTVSVVGIVPRAVSTLVPEARKVLSALVFG